MSETTRAATLTPVGTDDETRGQAIGRRMRAIGMNPMDLAGEAGRNRSLLYRVLKDEANVRDDSYRAFELALDRIEREHGHGGPDAVLSTEQGLIEFEVTGDFGVRVVVKGPIENAAELEASVARLIRDIRETKD
jgi:hypothetical protein